MEPTTIAARLATSAVAPLIRKLFVQEGAGAGLADKPVRISCLVSFRGEKRELSEKDLRKLAGELVKRATRAAVPHEAPDPERQRETADALAGALHSLGDLDMDDVQAVRLGPEGLARRLRRPDGLSEAAEAHFGPLLHTACLHILDFFTRRSTFVPRTLTEQTRQLDQLVTVTDLLAERLPSQTAEDARFEERYTEHLVRKHGELTIYGLDLNHAREWQLDSAYISLEASHRDQGLPMRAEQALSGHEKVLLRGGAGSGKTTLVQWLAVTTARQSYGEHLTQLIGRVPFVLPLRRVMEGGVPPAPDRFLHAVRSSAAGAQPEGWADRVLRAGRGLLLVDGIDEIPENERESVRRWMRELMADFPGNLWLVTARPSAVREDWLHREGFTELTLAPMSHADVGHFVRRWHMAAEADADLGEALLTAVRTHPDLGRLAVNPLMCGLLCALHRERRGFLPYSRKDLYEAALSMLLERRDVERGVSVDEELRLSKDTQIQLLQRLAHWMIRNDRAEMERTDALGQLERALVYMTHVPSDPSRVLRHLLSRSGLLTAPAVDRVAFAHRTFQDYLAAKAAVEEGDFPLLLDNAHKDQWEDVLRMSVALGRRAERKRILEGLVERDGRALLLAATCLEHATEIDPDTARHVMERTAELVPPASRWEARGLADLGGPLLLGLLPGPREVTDEEAVNVVITATRIAGDAALPLLARYAAHPSLEVRRHLVWPWHRFDTADYAREVIARLDETDLYFTAHDVDHLCALRELGGRSRVQVVGPYNPHEVVAHLVPERLTHLWLTEGYTTLDGDRWLDTFPHLHTLILPSPPDRYTAATIPGRVTLGLPPDEGER